MHTQYINDICINTVFADFKTGRVKGLVRKNEDASYTIILNSRLSHYQHKKTFEHELNHILNEDFEKYDVDNIERERRK